MAKGSGNTRGYSSYMKVHTDEEYYDLSKKYRSEALSNAETLKNNPKNIPVSKGIKGIMEISKSDIKTIVSKNTQDARFNAFKNLLARDIEGFISKARYEGWREVIDGKHPETAFFVYYGREWKEKAYLCIRKMKETGKYKPYAIINQHQFEKEKQSLRKDNPPE